MSCLQALLELSLLQQESTNRVLDTLLPQVLSCLDDQNGSTRLASGHVLKCLLYMKPSSLTGINRITLAQGSCTYNI